MGKRIVDVQADWSIIVSDKNPRWVEVLQQDVCVYCGRSGDLTREHIQPMSLGGQNTWDNLAPACQQCNQKRGNLPLLKWLITLSYWQQGMPLTKRQRREKGLWYPAPGPKRKGEPNETGSIIQ